MHVRHALAAAAVLAAAGITTPETFAANPPRPTPEEPSMTHAPHDQAATRFVDVQGQRIAWRRFGTPDGVPLVLLNRFRGTMDHWDPALLEALARDRPVIVFDSTGVGASEGEVPADLQGTARVAAAFIEAIGSKPVDLLGWSMGGAVAQLLTLERPDLVRRVVLAGTGPGGVPDAPRPPEKVWQVAAKPVNDDEDFLYLFFTDSPASRTAGIASLRRLDARLAASKSVVKAESWQRQAGAIAAWGAGKGSAYARLPEIVKPVLVANGQADVMVHAYNSYAMAQRLPDAKLVLYPDAGHGFLFQHAAAFGDEVNRFLR